MENFGPHQVQFSAEICLGNRPNSVDKLVDKLWKRPINHKACPESPRLSPGESYPLGLDDQTFRPRA